MLTIDSTMSDRVQKYDEIGRARRDMRGHGGTPGDSKGHVSQHAGGHEGHCGDMRGHVSQQCGDMRGHQGTRGDTGGHPGTGGDAGGHGGGIEQHDTQIEAQRKYNIYTTSILATFFNYTGQPD